MNSKWMIYAKKAPFQEIAARFGIDQVTARVIRNRDIIGDQAIDKYLHGTLKDLYKPELLSGAEKAVDCLQDLIRQGKKIRIIGDYDIDGVCATYILYTVLKIHGADVDYEIPDRMKDGYGLHERLIREAYESGVQAILTCDNGITAVNEIRYAKELGMQVIVTDHHQARYTGEGESRVYDLPPADVLVDPHLPGETYPDPDICGAVVAWKIMLLLSARAGGYDSAQYRYCRKLLAFAAIATVGDVMDLRDENRILVKWGLKALQDTDNPGLRSLIRATGLEGKELSAYHIGFIIGPCINAGGRLDTARRALELFLTKDPKKADALAQSLAALNTTRKALTEEGLRACTSLLEEGGMKKDRVYLLYVPGCHESIVGIVAGKIREKYNHPVFVVTDAQQEGLLKGSGRSVEKYIMHEELARCAPLLASYGGHPMAAGITLKKENLKSLHDQLNENCQLTEEDFVGKKMIDAAMPISYITPGLIRQLKVLEPCGKGNERPIFAQKDLSVLSIRVLGKDRKVIRAQVADSYGTRMTAVYFGDAQAFVDDLDSRFGAGTSKRLLAGLYPSVKMSILYYPALNEYRGSTSMQIVITDYR